MTSMRPCHISLNGQLSKIPNGICPTVFQQDSPTNYCKEMKTSNIRIRRAKERGHANYGWLNTYHSFSFGDYHDPRYMGYRALRVINDDTIKPGMGFGMHRHKDMEILTYVIDGALEHKDSMGNGSVIRAGNFQRMTAGTGVEHSEFNPSAKEPTRLLQIWIVPANKNLEPSYEEFSVGRPSKPMTLVSSDTPSQGALMLHQDARIYLGRLKEYETVRYEITSGRGIWIQMVHGKIKLADEFALDRGDGASIEDEPLIVVTSLTDTEFLMFDLA